MPGKGPIAKPDGKRARRNKPTVQMTVIESQPVKQPALPKSMPNGEPWPAITRAWWRQWGKDPLAADFRWSDWAELRDCAVIHGMFWSGDVKLAGELRLRTAKFGATAEDRARLRIQYAATDEADEKRRTSKAGANSRGKYQGLRAVD